MQAVPNLYCGTRPANRTIIKSCAKKWLSIWKQHGRFSQLTAGFHQGEWQRVKESNRIHWTSAGLRQRRACSVLTARGPKFKTHLNKWTTIFLWASKWLPSSILNFVNMKNLVLNSNCWTLMGCIPFLSRTYICILLPRRNTLVHSVQLTTTVQRHHLKLLATPVVPNRWVATTKWVANEWLWVREQQPQ